MRRPHLVAVVLAATVIIGLAVLLGTGSRDASPRDREEGALSTTTSTTQPGLASSPTTPPRQPGPAASVPDSTTTSPPTTTKYAAVFDDPDGQDVRLVDSGAQGNGEWRLYALNRGNSFCFSISVAYSQGESLGRAEGGRCGFKPLDAAAIEQPTSNVEVWYGTAPSDAVRVELRGPWPTQSVETKLLPHPHQGRFFTSPSGMRPDPTLIVAFDSAGREVGRHQPSG